VCIPLPYFFSLDPLSQRPISSSSHSFLLSLSLFLRRPSLLAESLRYEPYQHRLSVTGFPTPAGILHVTFLEIFQRQSRELHALYQPIALPSSRSIGPTSASSNLQQYGLLFDYWKHDVALAGDAGCGPLSHHSSRQGHLLLAHQATVIHDAWQHDRPTHHPPSCSNFA